MFQVAAWKTVMYVYHTSVFELTKGHFSKVLLLASYLFITLVKFSCYTYFWLVCEQSVQSGSGKKSPASMQKNANLKVKKKAEGKARYMDKEYSCTELVLIMRFLHLLSNGVKTVLSPLFFLGHPYLRAFLTLSSFPRIARLRWRLVELNDRHLLSHGKIEDCEQFKWRIVLSSYLHWFDVDLEPFFIIIIIIFIFI